MQVDIMWCLVCVCIMFKVYVMCVFVLIPTILLLLPFPFPRQHTITHTESPFLSQSFPLTPISSNAVNYSSISVTSFRHTTIHNLCSIPPDLVLLLATTIIIRRMWRWTMMKWMRLPNSVNRWKKPVLLWRLLKRLGMV